MLPEVAGVNRTLHHLLCFGGGGDDDNVRCITGACGRRLRREPRFGRDLLVFGFYGSFILAVAYTPVHVSLLDAGRRLRDHALTAEPNTPVKPWVENLTSLDKLLGLEAGGTGSI